MFKLLGNIYYSPTATEVAIGQRLSKLFLPKYHILNSGSIYESMIFFVVITSLLSRVQRYTFIFNCQTFIRTICIFLLYLYSRPFFPLLFGLTIAVCYPLSVTYGLKSSSRQNTIAITLKQNCIIVRNIVVYMLYIYCHTYYIYSTTPI